MKRWSVLLISLACVGTAYAQAYSKETLMALGKAMHQKHCQVCHLDDGSGLPPAFSAIKGSRIANGPIEAHIDVVLNGAPPVKGSVMLPFRNSLNDEQIAGVVTYQRNSWGNKGGIVQPEDVAKRRKR